MVIGTIGSLANGASFPLMLIFFANIIDLGIDYTAFSNPNGKVCEIPRNLTPIQTNTSLNFVDNMGQQAINLTSNLFLN
jgi:hypothetical protein